jgi:hypothetical protein
VVVEVTRRLRDAGDDHDTGWGNEMTTRGLRRVLLAAGTAAIAFALGYPATATAAPACPKNTVTVGNQGQVINLTPASQVCDDDPRGDGLLGDTPVLGNLPGLGGLL